MYRLPGNQPCPVDIASLVTFMHGDYCILCGVFLVPNRSPCGSVIKGASSLNCVSSIVSESSGTVVDTATVASQGSRPIWSRSVTNEMAFSPSSAEITPPGRRIRPPSPLPLYTKSRDGPTGQSNFCEECLGSLPRPTQMSQNGQLSQKSSSKSDYNYVDFFATHMALSSTRFCC
jgi:hypothetical protein